MMQCEFDVKSRFYALIVLNIAFNFVRANQNLSSLVYDIKNEQDFIDYVVKSNGVVITQFHAPWCAPCRQISPSLEATVREYNGKFKLAKVNLQSKELNEIASKQGVRTIPCVASFRHGVMIDHMKLVRTSKDVIDFVQKQTKVK